MSLRQKVTIGFVVVVALGALAYFVVMPAYQRYHAQTLINTATQVLNSAYQKAQQRHAQELIAAQVGATTVSGQDLYLLAVASQSSQSKAEQVRDHPSVVTLEDTVEGVTNTLAQSQWLEQHQYLPPVSSATLRQYRLQRLTEMTARPVHSWQQAMQLVLYQHSAWVPNWYWTSQYQVNVGYSMLINQQISAQSQQAIQTAKQQAQLFQSPADFQQQIDQATNEQLKASERIMRWINQEVTPQSQKQIHFYNLAPVSRALQ